jgi:hypothetical protein
MASLQERLDEFKKSFGSGAPPYNARGNRNDASSNGGTQGYRD